MKNALVSRKSAFFSCIIQKKAVTLQREKKVSKKALML